MLSNREISWIGCLVLLANSSSLSAEKLDHPVRYGWSNQGTVHAAALNPTGHKMVTGGDKGFAVVWNTETAKRETTMTPGAEDIYAMAYSPDATHFAMGCENKKADTKRWVELRAKDKNKKVLAIGPRPISLAFSPDNRWLAVGTTNGRWQESKVWVYDTDSGEKVAELAHGGERRTFRGNYVAFAPNGEHLVTTGVSHSFHLWKVGQWEHVKEVAAHDSQLYGFAFSNKGDLLATFSKSDVEVKLWRVPDYELETELVTKGSLSCLAFSNDDKRLAVGSYQSKNKIGMWDLASRRPVYFLDSSTASWGPDYLAFLPDEKTLVSEWANSVKFWDLSKFDDPKIVRAAMFERDPHLRNVVQHIEANANAAELTFSAFERISDDAQFELLAERCTRLKSLKLIDTNPRFRYPLNGRGFAFLATLPIESLTLHNMDLATVSSLAKLKSLKNLEITGVCRIEDWSGFEKLVQLESLDLSGAQIGARELSRLSNLKQLKHLTVFGSISVGRESANYFTGEQLGWIQSLTNLETLEMEGEVIGPEAAPFLAKLTKLKKLEIAGTRIGDGAGAIVENMNSLTDARLGALSAGSLRKLAALPKLQSLYFYGPSVASYDLAILGESSSLRSLSVGGFWTPYGALKYARDLKTMPQDQAIAYDQIRMLVDLHGDLQIFETRRERLLAAGLWMPPVHRRGGALIEATDSRHPRHGDYLQARKEMTDLTNLLQNDSLSSRQVLRELATRARAQVKKAFAADAAKSEQLLEMISRYNAR